MVDSYFILFFGIIHVFALPINAKEYYLNMRSHLLACFSDYLVNRAEITLGSLDKLQQSHMVYLGNRNGM